jgi:GNAT superfamily N-acetyltransferase
VAGIYDIGLTDAADDDARDAIRDGLNAYNRDQAGYFDGKPLCVIVREKGTGKPLGGLLGRTSMGLCYIDTFHLPKAMRGAGVGKEILAMAEEEARRRGCAAAVLYTVHFQAPGFYAQQGWSELGRVEVPPPGHTRVFMTKRLS